MPNAAPSKSHRAWRGDANSCETISTRSRFAGVDCANASFRRLTSTSVTAAEQEPKTRGPEETSLRPSEAMIMLDYQVIRVPGDKPIDLMGFHVHHKMADWLYVGAGAYAPLVGGEYGGFTAYDIGGHVQQRLTTHLFATAGLSGGGGGGGRSIEQSKVLSGTGRFFKGYVGLGYDFGDFSIGANVARMKFSHSLIDSTHANVFVEIPYTHYFARDSYWYAGLGVGYHGLPLYNHIIGGVGQRVSLSPRISVYGQLGIGSGGYAPHVMGTDAGLLVYPKVSAEYALTKDLGLSVSAGYLVAPKGSSKNQTFGVALTHHIRASDGGGATGAPTYRGFRVSVFQQTEFAVRYRDVDRGRLQMLAIEADTLVNDHWYVPLQASVAYSAYLGYPGYGELLAGIGVQSHAQRGDPVQLFAQLMAGANVHGHAAKAEAGLRYTLGDRLALRMAAGRIEARNSAFIFVLDNRSRTTSICSTGDKGLSTLRITQMRLRSSLPMSNSSLRVPDLCRSIAGNRRLSESLRSR